MKELKKKLKFVVEKTKTGFSSYAEESSIYTTGKTIPDLINNCFEASSLHFEEKGFELNHNNIKLEIDFNQFFQYYKILNAKVLAERIGMNASLLSQYVRGIKKPSEKQSEKILTGIHQIGQELSEINLIYDY
ncbi:MAG: XRE family transcriptional regulator [Bacteroidetes bacterium]|nr:XRE family transcriptional regulator [Bacteroidota bacterium]